MTTSPHATAEHPNAAAMPRLLTLRDVTAATALSRSAVYALMAESRFPKPIRIGTRAVRWVEQEVLDFIASRRRPNQRGAHAHRPPGRSFSQRPRRKTSGSDVLPQRASAGAARGAGVPASGRPGVWGGAPG